MAILENCVERATALAAACGWLAFGGGAEAIVGVTVGAAGLATLASEVTRRHGPESAAALSAIRKRVRTDLESFAKAERWDAKADIRAADLAMQSGLVGCFLDRRELAASARSIEGFPGAATSLIFEKLMAREPATFGPSGAEAGKDFARTVIETALKAAIENQAYFTELQPHLLVEALQGIGTIEAKIDDVHQTVKDTHALLLEINRRTNSADSSSSDFDPNKSAADPLALVPEIGASTFFENIKILLRYLYINEAYAYYHSDAYEFKCLRASGSGQYFGFEYTPYYVDITSDEDHPKRNRTNYRTERLEWLAISEMLVECGMLAKDDDKRRRPETILSLTPKAKQVMAAHVAWTRVNEPDKVPVKDFFA